MICTRSTTAAEPTPAWLGAPCPDCGHTTLAHPGDSNPALPSCLVCQVQDSLDQLRTQMAQVTAAVLEPAPTEQTNGMMSARMAEDYATTSLLAAQLTEGRQP